MSCTVNNLTQSKSKTNNFRISSGKLANLGLFARIHTEQWHIFRELKHLTKNVNVINLASLLAVLPRMGIFAYEITQAELAEKMAEMFKMDFVPARNTISKWENELRKMGLLEIPQHVDWTNTKTKIRVITEKFWDMSRLGLENLSYTCPPVTYCVGKVERVEHFNPKERINNNISETMIRGRARDDHKKEPDKPVRAIATHENKNFHEKQKTAMRPPKNNTGGARKLNSFENSVSHWLFQNRNLKNYREAVILFARFLELGCRDDYYRQLQRNWQQCGDASRPGLTTDLIRFLRTVDTSTSPDSVRPPLRIVDPAPIPMAPGSNSPHWDNPKSVIDDIADVFTLTGQMDVSPGRFESNIRNNKGLNDLSKEQYCSNTRENEPESIRVIQCMVRGRQDCDEKNKPLVARFKAARNDEKEYILAHIESLLLLESVQAIEWLETLRKSKAF